MEQDQRIMRMMDAGLRVSEIAKAVRMTDSGILSAMNRFDRDGLYSRKRQMDRLAVRWIAKYVGACASGNVDLFNRVESGLIQLWSRQDCHGSRNARLLCRYAAWAADYYETGNEDSFNKMRNAHNKMIQAGGEQWSCLKFSSVAKPIRFLHESDGEAETAPSMLSPNESCCFSSRAWLS